MMHQAIADSHTDPLTSPTNSSNDAPLYKTMGEVLGKWDANNDDRKTIEEQQ